MCCRYIESRLFGYLLGEEEYLIQNATESFIAIIAHLVAAEEGRDARTPVA